MKSSILYACLAVAGLLASACGGYDPVGTCRAACTECQPEGTDCEAQCANAQEQYDDARERAVTAGCASQFDTAANCSSGGDLCDTSRCSSEVGDVTECFVAFCTDNPTSEACTAP